MDKTTVSSYIAGLMVLALIAVVGALMFFEVPNANKDLFNVGLMAIVAGVGTILGFLFGSSLGSAKKDATIAKLAAPEGPDGGQPPPVSG